MRSIKVPLHLVLLFIIERNII